MIGRDAPAEQIALELDELAVPDELPTQKYPRPPSGARAPAALTVPAGSMVLAPELAEIAALMPKLGPRARAVLVTLARRLAAGAETYGDDFERAADWRREARSEALDMAVYLAVELTVPSRGHL